MAISNTLVEYANATSILRVNTGTEAAVTTIILCNTNNILDAFVNMWVVPDGGVPGGALNQVLKTVHIPATETFVMDTEKFILSQRDEIMAQVTTAEANQIVNALVSTVLL
jgi:hypothetical protein